MSSNENTTEDTSFQERMEAFISWFIDVSGVEEIGKQDINDVLTRLINTFGDIEVSEFDLSRATMPTPEYVPGMFPIFQRIGSIRELVASTPITLIASFDIEVTDVSRIKARGFGELDLFKDENGRLRVNARDLWFIEEVQEIEPLENVDERTGIIKSMVRAIFVHVIARFLSGILTRMLDLVG